jgi:hypothetical protein
MAGPLPLAITVTPPQQAVLEALLRQHACPQTLALRARIVLSAATGLRNVPLAHDLGCTPKTVAKWRTRWAAAHAQLAAVEGDAADLKRMIAACSPMPHALALPIPSRPSRLSRSSIWLAHHQPTPGDLSMPGRRVSWPMKQSNARLFPRFRPRRWDDF